MTHDVKSQSSDNKPHILESRFDQSKYNFHPNSAYRAAKQHEFLMSDNHLKSVNDINKSINYL